MRSIEYIPNGVCSKKMIVECDDFEVITKVQIVGGWIKTSQYLLFVFLDKSSSYNEERDLMAIGAAIENFMLSAYDEGIGTCWLGGILSNTDEIWDIINFNDPDCLLKAVITVGKYDDTNIIAKRKPLEDVLVK